MSTGQVTIVIERKLLQIDDCILLRDCQSKPRLTGYIYRMTEMSSWQWSLNADMCSWYG